MIKNYIKVFEDGSQVATKYAPSFGGNYNGFGDYYDIKSKKWYSGVAVFADDFSDSSNWTLGTGWSVYNNELVNSDGGDSRFDTSAITVIAHKKYLIKAHINVSSNNGNTSFQVFDSGTIINDALSSGTVYDYSQIIIPNQSSITIGGYSAGLINISKVAIIPLNDDGTVDTSNATPYTSQPTYLPYEVTVANGQPVDVDSKLFPTLVEDYVKADIVEGETKGKNSCTAWCNFDGATTPPTIRDSYNVSQVIRTGTGNFDVYFEVPMNNAGYTLSGISGTGTIADANVYSLKLLSPDTNKTTSKVSIGFRYGATSVGNVTETNIQVFGGKDA